ncbi:MAG: DUF2760 domain-containing protein, partial [Gemmataceae bacterium]
GKLYNHFTLSECCKMDLFLGLVLGFMVAGLFIGVTVFARAGSLGRANWGLRVAGRATFDPNFAAKVNELMGLPTSTMPVPAASMTPSPAVAPRGGIVAAAKPSLGPVRILAVLQAESRFVDFLLEDISPFPDAQVGQAVREIHRKAQAVLKQHLVMEPVVGASEGETTTIPKGFDASAIRVLGNVTGTPPYTGQVQHPGWRVREVKLQPLPAGQDENVLQPAEIQLP